VKKRPRATVALGKVSLGPLGLDMIVVHGLETAPRRGEPDTVSVPTTRPSSASIRD
jgi:hypothetical protein